MLDQKGFDLWVDGYDSSVNLSDEEDTYPFAGYRKVLNRIYNEVHRSDSGSILDIGFGTGTLTNKLYQDGYKIYGIDFSEKMLAIAQDKMPDALLVQGDFSNGLPQVLSDNRYDYIISTYALHHLTPEGKLKLIGQLFQCLNERGKILLGDIAFRTCEELESCRQECGEEWDSDEFYIVFEELKKHFPEDILTFEQISDCSAVIAFQL